MIDFATRHIHLSVETKERGTGPVGIETTISERQALTSVRLDKGVLLVVVEVARIEADGCRTEKFHNAIGAVVDETFYRTEILGVHQAEAIGSTTIEVAVHHHVLASCLHTDHTA